MTPCFAAQDGFSHLRAGERQVVLLCGIWNPTVGSNDLWAEMENGVSSSFLVGIAIPAQCCCAFWNVHLLYKRNQSEKWSSACISQILTPNLAWSKREGVKKERKKDSFTHDPILFAYSAISYQRNISSRWLHERRQRYSCCWDPRPVDTNCTSWHICRTPKSSTQQKIGTTRSNRPMSLLEDVSQHRVVLRSPQALCPRIGNLGHKNTKRQFRQIVFSKYSHPVL